MRFLIALLLLILSFATQAQTPRSVIDSFTMFEDVTIGVDRPKMKFKKLTRIIIYALPNGNTIAQTMGKKLKSGDDWHYDIQHIRAQTAFIRNANPNQNVIVYYVSNKQKSWPAWKKQHSDYRELIPKIFDSIRRRYLLYDQIELSGHSGGGSFIFGFLDAFNEIPHSIKRISFIDSNYGYDSSYSKKFINWLSRDIRNTLMVFAYNDSVALYNGKPVVSATGGTWHRSHMMMNDLAEAGKLTKKITDSVVVYETKNKNLAFFFKPNPNKGIYHTQQVELNGFIHAAFYRTSGENKGYSYYGNRSYTRFIAEE